MLERTDINASMISVSVGCVKGGKREGWGRADVERKKDKRKEEREKESRKQKRKKETE